MICNNNNWKYSNKKWKSSQTSNMKWNMLHGIESMTEGENINSYTIPKTINIEKHLSNTKNYIT